MQEWYRADCSVFLDDGDCVCRVHGRRPPGGRKYVSAGHHTPSQAHCRALCEPQCGETPPRIPDVMLHQQRRPRRHTLVEDWSNVGYGSCQCGM